MLKLVLRVVFSVLLLFPCALLTVVVPWTYRWEKVLGGVKGAIFLGIYGASLVALWHTRKKRRLAAFAAGAAVAIAFGLVAMGLLPSFIYGSVALAFTGVAASIGASLFVLRTLLAPNNTEEGCAGNAVRWVIWVIIGAFLASSFSTAPYALFPWLLAGVVLAGIGVALMDSRMLNWGGDSWCILFLVAVGLFNAMSWIISRAIVDLSVSSLPV